MISPRSVPRQPPWQTTNFIVAGHINAGTIPDLRSPPEGQSSDFYFLPAETPEQAVSLILNVVGERIPARFGIDPVGEVQVLCPMARGGCGSRSLNIELQKLLNPDPSEQVERFGWRFAPGDKVMHIANNYEKEVFNGDVGTIDAIHSDNSELSVLFPSSEAGPGATSAGSRAVVYGWGELDHLVPAYACTIHKSQGSEYPAVVIPLLTQHYAMLQRNLVYTGLTRGKRLVVLVGQKKALRRQIRSQFRGKRRIPFMASDHEIIQGSAITWTLRAKQAPTHIAETWVRTSWIVEVTASARRDGKPFQAQHLFLTSLRTTPQALLQLVRDCWSIECWHWIRDTQLHEDAHRYRANGAAAMATLRTAALNLLRLTGFRQSDPNYSR